MIPVNIPHIGAKERDYVLECVEMGWVSSEGRFVAEFEKAFADFIGTRHGIAVVNGTAALELSLAACGFAPGSEIILPAFTIVSCVLAVIRTGLKPVLVDAEPGTWCMDPGRIESKITDCTRAIMPVHIYGHPVDMDPVIALAEKHRLLIIEDAAEAHGARYKDRKCGTLGDLAAFSFYANKLVTTGEGGMVLTDNDDLAARLYKLRNLAFETSQRFIHHEAGYNFRMSNLQAAVGLAQVEGIEAALLKKRRQGRRYREHLAHIPGVHLQTIREWADPIYWVNPIVLDGQVPMDAKVLAEKLQQNGVQSRPFFWPMHDQPVFNKMGLFRNETHPVAENIARRGLYLPSGMTLAMAEIDQVCETLAEILAD